MNLKHTLIICLILLSGFAFGQAQQTKSFGFISDNDVYISLTQDQYYTNGLTLVYQYLSKTTSDKLAKKINTIQLGQYMYNAYSHYVPNIANQDRPFAGYLFADFSATKFYKNESFFKMQYQLGILGPASQAEGVQKWYHRTMGLPAIAGWNYQIQNQLGVNVNAMYLKNMGYGLNNNIDINAFSQAKLGVSFDELSLGFVSRIAFKTLNPVYNSAIFNSNIGNDKTDKSSNEFYFFVKPKLTYIAYNATIQGSPFKHNSPLTFNPQRFKASVQWGLTWTSKRFNFEYAITNLTKAVANNRVTAHKYGTIAVIYRFN